MRSRSFALGLLAACLIAGLIGIPAAFAAGGNVEVTVITQEKDKKDTAAGATILLGSKTKAVPDKAAEADVNGMAVFPGLPPGDYFVEASYPGFGKRRIDLQVVENRVTKVTLVLIPELVEELTVKGTGKVVELDKGAQTTTTFSEESFSDLPVLGREYQSVLSLAPGVQDSDGDGNPTVHGSRERDFKMTVDSVSNVDPLTGEFMSNVNPDAIEEIEVMDSGADASFGGAVGAFGRIITKSGSNEFEGSFNLFIRDSAFENDGAGGDPLDFSLFQPSVYFSGPVVKDRMWYSFSHEYRKQSAPIVVFGGENFVQDFTRTVNLDKITWQVTPKNRLQLQYSADPFEVSPAGVDSLTPKDTGVNLSAGGPTFSLKWTATYSPTFFWESTVAFSDINLKQYPYNRAAVNNCFPDAPGLTPYYCLNLTSQRRSGPFFFDYQDFRKRWSYLFDAEQFVGDWLGGSHRIKSGFALERARYLQEQSSKGFTTLRVIGGAAYDPLSPRPVAAQEVGIGRIFPARFDMQSRGNYFAFYLSDGYEPLPNLNVTVGFRFNREELSSDGYEPFSPRKERDAFLADPRYQACLASGEQPITCINQYIGDYFTVSPLDDLEVSGFGGCDVPSRIPPESLFGNQYSPNFRPCSYIKNFRFAGGTPKYRKPQVINIINNNLSPRLSFSWDPRNDGKTKITGGFNRYFGDTFLAPLTSEAGPDQTLRQLTISNRGDVLGGSETSALQINMIDRGLKSQRSDELTFAVEREIAPETSLRVRYVRRNYNDQFQDTDINHLPLLWDDLDSLPARILDEYPNCRRIGKFADCSGRVTRKIVGYTPQGPQYRLENNPDGVADLYVVSPMFGNIYKIGNYNETKYKAWLLEINRRFFQNWEMSMSYAWSKAIGQAEDYNQGLGDDPTTLDDERGPLSTDQRHVVKVNGRVFIPRWGGFRIGGTVNYESGLPYSLLRSANVVDFPSVLGANQTGYHFVQYVSPRTVYPSGQRNDRRNKSYWDLNLNFQKEFQLGEVKATLQADVYNLLNDDTLQITGIARSEAGGDIPSAFRNFGRQFQVALKLNF